MECLVGTDCRRHPRVDPSAAYSFTVNNPEPHELIWKSNYIRTTKYTILSFLPVNLFGQFRRFYNLYFLLAAILSLIPLGLAPVSSFTQIAPLVIVLVVTAIKDAIEDLTRYKSDRKANNVIFSILRHDGQTTMRSAEIKPGDIVYVEKGQQFPADLVIISSSQEDGLAFIETAELDGETNLKKRQALHSLASLNNDEKLKDFRATVECGQPDEFLYKYQGRITFGDKVESLNPDQLLLRGAILRNTAFIYGIACYVGPDTKIMRNLKSSSLKFSTLETRLNYLVLGIFALNAIILLISAVLSGVWQGEFTSAPGNPTPAWYLYWDWTGLEVGGAHAMTYYILYTYMVPISLFVTIEVSRLCQAVFMYWDNGMMSKDNIRMVARNSNLNEDLGRIDHVFSDKTGTLTQNIMTLKHFFVNGRIIDENGDGEIAKYAKGEKGEPDDHEITRQFLRALSVCHTVVPSIDEKTDALIYEGDSPDETALLEGLRPSDILFTAKTPKGMAVKFFGEVQNFEVLKVIEFNSTRKRMSVILRTPEGKIELFCKGADNVILERARPDLTREFKENLNTAIANFSRIGLRTLLVATLAISDEEYAAFIKEYHEAETSLENRDEKMQTVSEKLEKNLTILGATAVEDKLQDDVAETIDYLIQAGIRVWMLTGDKLETAISIGKSTKFLGDGMVLMMVDTEDSESTGETMKKLIEQHSEKLLPQNWNQLNIKSTYGLVITGKALVYALADHADTFLQLSEMAQSVVCCRVSPLQKSQVVKLVKKKKNRICLSIGDGANDVSMIQVANIGVGIIGLEGTQAVRASDYAFKEFKALRRLISVHGRYSYIRMSKLILFSFYKNLTLIFPQFLFGFWSAWSGIPLYQELVLTCFNIFFTSIPPFFIALFERDLQEETINKNPQVYFAIRADKTFNLTRMFEWLASALIHGIILYFFFYLSYAEGIVTIDGREFGGFPLAIILMAFYVIITVLFKFAFSVHHVHWPYFIAGILSFIALLIIVFSINTETYALFIEDTSQLGMTVLLLGSGYFYLSILLACTTALIPDLVYAYCYRTFSPADYQILQECEEIEKKALRENKLKGELKLTEKA